MDIFSINHFSRLHTSAAARLGFWLSLHIQGGRGHKAAEGVLGLASEATQLWKNSKESDEIEARHLQLEAALKKIKRLKRPEKFFGSFLPYCFQVNVLELSENLTVKNWEAFIAPTTSHHFQRLFFCLQKKPSHALDFF